MIMDMNLTNNVIIDTSTDDQDTSNNTATADTSTPNIDLYIEKLL